MRRHMDRMPFERELICDVFYTIRGTLTVYFHGALR